VLWAAGEIETTQENMGSELHEGDPGFEFWEWKKLLL
jgi:hypothetical protein